MTDRLMECITNPVKCKLLLEIHSQGKATAKQLADIYTDIPQATLYRHLKKMLSDGILQVVEETQVEFLKRGLLMQRKDAGFVSKMDFKEQTPEILLKAEKLNLLYEKAFLSREDKSKTEYAQNTTTWD